MTAQRAEGFGALDVSLDDRDLAIAFKGGLDNAYNVIYRRYHSRVENICRRMLAQPEDAMEATQEAFLRVYQGLPRFNGRYQLGAWIARIATNVCLDQIRVRSRRPVDCVPDEFLELEPEPVDASNPEAVFMRKVEGRRVRRVLDSLPPLHRAAIVLRDFKGLSYEEVADILEVTPVQVKALIHRARKGFRRSWTEIASIFIPARLAQRFKGVEDAARDQLVHTVTPSSQVVASCAGALQQCGQFVAERAAVLVTATMFSAVVATGGTASPAPLPAPAAALELTTSQLHGESNEKGPPSRKLHSREPQGTEAPGAPGAPLPSATPLPNPSPSPSPSMSPTPDPSPSPSTSPTPTPPPPPVATDPAIGFDRGTEVPSVVPVSNSYQIDCGAWTIHQELETRISDGDASYPIVLNLDFRESFGIGFTIEKAGRSVAYSGGAAMIEKEKGPQTTTFEFRGSYGTGDSAASRADLPESGLFTAKLVLDCATLRVVTERLVFSP